MGTLVARIAALAFALGLALALLAEPPLALGRNTPLLEFETMAGVTGPYVGAANPIRGVGGGGLPWSIAGASGLLQPDGHLELEVHGLVLAAGPLAGTNPVADFAAVVSCQTINGGAATVTNVSTAPFPATTSGDAHVDTQLALPSPCLAPIVFVTSPTGRWFAVTGQ